MVDLLKTEAEGKVMCPVPGSGGIKKERKSEVFLHAEGQTVDRNELPELFTFPIFIPLPPFRSIHIPTYTFVNLSSN